MPLDPVPAIFRETPDVVLANPGDATVVAIDAPETRAREGRAQITHYGRRVRIHELRAALVSPLPYRGASRMSPEPHARAAAGRYESELYRRRALEHELDALLDEEQREAAARATRARPPSGSASLLSGSPMYARYLREKRERPALLSRHPEAGGRTAIRSAAPTARVRRTVEQSLQVERRAAGTMPVLRGYAARFDELSEDLGGWRERIAPGAFSNVLSSEECLALLNHDPNVVIAAVRDGSLRLTQDTRGLYVEIRPMDTQTIRDLVVTPVEQGKIRKMSFAFDVGEADWVYEGGVDIRVVKRVSRLYDVSVVAYPAYSQTDIGARGGAPAAWKTVVAVGAA